MQKAKTPTDFVAGKGREKKRPMTTLIVLVLIIFLVLYIGSIIVRSMRVDLGQSTEKVGTTSQEYANWKTYSSQQYGYSLQHPDTFVPTDYGGGEGFKGIPYLNRVYFDDGVPEKTTAFSVEVRETPLDQAVLLFKEEMGQAAGSIGIVPKEEKLKVADREATRLTYVSEDIIDRFTVVFVQREKYTYMIISQHPPGDTLPQEVLSSFKFTN